ncbi:hypothetical protein PG987_005413 [Apiospora arundinis]
MRKNELSKFLCQRDHSHASLAPPFSSDPLLNLSWSYPIFNISYVGGPVTAQTPMYVGGSSVTSRLVTEGATGVIGVGEISGLAIALLRFSDLTSELRTLNTYADPSNVLIALGSSLLPGLGLSDVDVLGVSRSMVAPAAAAAAVTVLFTGHFEYRSV